MKKVSTSDGQKAVKTSPYWQDRVNGIPGKIAKMKSALRKKNFTNFGEIIEEECLNMHRVMQTQTPPLVYWNDVTKEIMRLVTAWRKRGLPVYFTIDAGPNVHLICEGKNETNVLREVKTVQGIQQLIVNKPATGARLINKHLF